jgi:hypothetical protein
MVGFGLAALFPKGQLASVFVPIDAKDIARSDLTACQQIGEWANEVLLDSPLQMACTVTRVHSFAKQELSAGSPYTKQKQHLGRLKNCASGPDAIQAPESRVAVLGSVD